jgi:hypothetical protein
MKIKFYSPTIAMVERGTTSKNGLEFFQDLKNFLISSLMMTLKQRNEFFISMEKVKLTCIHFDTFH